MHHSDIDISIFRNNTNTAYLDDVNTNRKNQAFIILQSKLNICRYKCVDALTVASICTF